MGSKKHKKHKSDKRDRYEGKFVIDECYTSVLNVSGNCIYHASGLRMAVVG